MSAVIPAILIIDLEVDPNTQTVFKIGAYRPDLDLGFESKSFSSDSGFCKALAEMAHLTEGAAYLMGHNLLAHDLPYLKKIAPHLACCQLPTIDTLRLSPLAFPQNPYHRLIKNHKIIASEINSPEADCRACWQLFQDQSAAFGKLKQHQPEIFSVFHHLFGTLPYQEGHSIAFSDARDAISEKALISAIYHMMQDDTADKSLKVCRSRLKKLIFEDIRHPDLAIPLAYALSWLRVSGGNSVLAPWVAHQFPETPCIIAQLRDHDCGDSACRYCQEILNPQKQLKRYFGLEQFRMVKGFEGGQQAIVESGMKGEHVLAVLPTGGGKSLCFQLPALNRYYRNGGLTIVVAPLQSLMKDQVDNLRKKGIAGVDTLNGMLSVTERADILDKIALGDIGILFVAPEQFRNSSFISAIKHRQINGWVFDEAHCLSKWGHDFRPDYLYAAKFIRQRRDNSPTQELAPISCFTATAKPDVLQDITEHFRQELGIEFKQFIGDNERSNLAYEVLEVSDGAKSQRINELLHRELDHQSGGAVVFVARRKSAERYAEYLRQQNWICEYFHAGLLSNQKADIQESFIRGDVRVIVATNAFGMGVDKPDVRLVIHAEITGSLENYLQEAGRAGRDQAHAMCVLLFDRQDVDTQFGISTQSQLKFNDFRQIWRKLNVMQSGHQDKALVVSSGEILRDTEQYLSFNEDEQQADTKLKTALAWLERANLLTRTENQTRIFPARSARLNQEQALQKIAAAKLSRRKQELYRCIVELIYERKEDSLISTDELSKATACSFTELRGFLTELETLGILVNDTRITINLRTDNKAPSSKRLATVLAWESRLWEILRDKLPEADQQLWQHLNLRTLCQGLREQDLESRPSDIKSLLYALADDKSAAKNNSSGNLDIRDIGNDTLKLRFKSADSTWESLQEDAELRRRLCQSLLSFFIGKTGGVRIKDAMAQSSFHELKQIIEDDLTLAAQIPENRRDPLLKQALLFMHKQEVIKLNHGMTILRHAMTIELNPDALSDNRQYRKHDYEPLATFYGEKHFQIHVMQEYALRALNSLENAWELVRDYFSINEKTFKQKWFKGRAAELGEAVSAETLKEITLTLNKEQKEVVTDKSERNRLVLAGPGSGKTRVIVNRVAYLLRVQHVSPTAVIVLTFNRLAAQEIKRRLHHLVGNLAHALTVLTYDGMAMRLLGLSFEDVKQQQDGKPENDNLFKEWCRQAAAMLSAGLNEDAEDDEARNQIMGGFRYILVDEYQDISEEHYQLVSALAGRQRTAEESKLTILAVGDDDQNIYEWNGTSNQYIERFKNDYDVEQEDFLTFNYRSSQEIIQAANALIQDLPQRLKASHAIRINPEREAENRGGRWAALDAERQGRVRIIRSKAAYKRTNSNETHDDANPTNLQAQAVIKEIMRLQAIEAIAWRDIAVLAREHSVLAPLQAYCEQEHIPYFLSRDKANRIKLRQKREFVRLLDDILKQEQWSAQDVIRLMENQGGGGNWERYFRQMAQDFRLAYPPEAQEAENSTLSAALLKNWLYDYVGNESDNGSEGLFLGTVHSAKGLEFKHVFILDGAWKRKEAAEQRLYYVAMTRAIETLTLMQSSDKHHWIDKLPPETERLTWTFTEDDSLNTQYRSLGLADIDIGEIVRDKKFPPQPSKRNVIPKMKAVQALNTGDAIEIRPSQYGLEFWTKGILIGKTSQAFNQSEAALIHAYRNGDLEISARVADFYVRYRHQENEAFLMHYPKEIEKWAVVIPQLIFKN